MTAENDVTAKLRRRADNWQPWIDDDLEAEVGYMPDHMRYHQALDRAAADEIERLRAALDSFVKIADEAATQWDNDNDARVGKMLLAMSGHAPRYRADIDAIHALRRRAADVPARPVNCPKCAGNPCECQHEWSADALRTDDDPLKPVTRTTE